MDTTFSFKTCMAWSLIGFIRLDSEHWEDSFGLYMITCLRSSKLKYYKALRGIYISCLHSSNISVRLISRDKPGHIIELRKCFLHRITALDEWLVFPFSFIGIFGTNLCSVAWNRSAVKIPFKIISLFSTQTVKSSDYNSYSSKIQTNNFRCFSS